MDLHNQPPPVTELNAPVDDPTPVPDGSEDPAIDPGESEEPQGTAWLVWLSLLLIGLAYQPLLIAFVDHLRHRPQYRFFLLPGVAAVLLGLARFGGLGPIQPSMKFRVRWLAFACWLLLGLAIGLHSSWLAAVSFPITGLCVAAGFGGRTFVQAMLPSAALMLLMVPLPLGFDLAIARSTESGIAVVGSQLLDYLKIPHIRAGAALQLLQKDLRIDQVCDGMVSLLPGVALAVFFGAALRRSAGHIVALALAAIGFLLLGYVVQVIVVGAAGEWWKIDLGAGWKHNILGVGVFVLNLILLVSADQFLLFFSRGIPLYECRYAHYLYKQLGAWKYSTNLVTELRKALQPPPEGEPPDPPPTCLIEQQRSWLARWITVVAYGSLIVWQIVALINFGGKPNAGGARELAPLAIPKQLGDWQRTEEIPEEQDRPSIDRKQSQTWYFRQGSLRASVSVEYPFRAWRETASVYEARGWVPRKQVNRAFDDEAPSAVEVSLANAARDDGALWFGMIDESGHWLNPSDGNNPWNLFKARVQSPWRTNGRQTIYELQVFVRSVQPLSENDRRQIKELFRLSRAALRAELADAEAAR